MSQLSLITGLTAAAVALAKGYPEPVVTIAASVAVIAVVFSIFLLHCARIGLYRTLSRARIANEERRRLFQTDAATEAMTRRHFLNRVQHSIRARATGVTTTLILIDIDYFKQLNDSLGHPAGDAALLHTVRALKHHFPMGSVGRLGGDEFGVMIQNHSTEWCSERITKFLDVIRQPVHHSEWQISLSVSVGIADVPNHAHDVSTLFHNADIALYASKAAGRGRVTVFDAEMLADRRHQRFLERELRAAVYLNHLELHYQPVIDTTGRTRALEGLVRWRHPSRGVISPGEFIPIAEQSILIDHLGEWVFRRACADRAHFPDCRLSINISGEQLKRDTIVLMTERVLKETGCRASDFVLEITETVATDATAEVLKRLDRLRSIGFRIALDDFGTGHCGFNYLKTLPIDCIKIDRSYISNLSHDRVAQVLVAALTEVGRLKNINVVAEGIETEDDLLLARAAGCDRFQGYFICRPTEKQNLPRLVFDIPEGATAAKSV